MTLLLTAGKGGEKIGGGSVGGLLGELSALSEAIIINMLKMSMYC